MLVTVEQFNGGVTGGPNPTPLVSNLFTYPVPEQIPNYGLSSFKATEADAQLGFVNDFSLLTKYMTNNSYIQPISSYIICRLEGKDLVIRAKIETEVISAYNPNDVGERVAIMPNVFSADGLNHTLKLIFRPEGVEVYKDYSHLGINNNEKIGICLWRKPSLSSVSQIFESFEIPKYLIPSCAPAPYLANLFVANTSNTNNDIPHAWDLLIGLPTNIDFYFKKVSIFENYGVDSFNDSENITSASNYTAEYWSFTMSDNEGDANDLKISCEFSQIEPNIAGANYSYIYPVEQFNNKIVVKDLKLSSKQLLPTSSQQKYYNIIQDFFNVKKIFEQNAYMKNIHEAYEYENFNSKVIKLYNLYSSQVLSYDSLLPFLDLIENKFKPIIKNFIPIVINISEFGRLIKNSLFNQPKFHYKNVHKKCIGKTIGNSLIQIRIFELIAPGNNFIIELENSNVTSLIPPTPIIWTTTMELTEFEILSVLRNPAINPNPNKIKILMNEGLLAIIVDAQWYYSTYGQNSNGIKLLITNTTTPQPIITVNFDYGSLDFSINTCGSIEHKLPVRNSKNIFVYYDSENQPHTFIYNASEVSSNNTYLNL